MQKLINLTDQKIFNCNDKQISNYVLNFLFDYFHASDLSNYFFKMNITNEVKEKNPINIIKNENEIIKTPEKKKTTNKQTKYYIISQKNICIIISCNFFKKNR